MRGKGDRGLRIEKENAYGKETEREAEEEAVRAPEGRRSRERGEGIRYEPKAYAHASDKVLSCESTVAYLHSVRTYTRH